MSETLEQLDQMEMEEWRKYREMDKGRNFLHRIKEHLEHDCAKTYELAIGTGWYHPLDSQKVAQHNATAEAYQTVKGFIGEIDSETSKALDEMANIRQRRADLRRRE